MKYSISIIFICLLNISFAQGPPPPNPCPVPPCVPVDTHVWLLIVAGFIYAIFTMTKVRKLSAKNS